MDNTTDIEFQTVSKEFLIGSFGSIVRSTLGMNNNCEIVQALHNISFAVENGELVGVLGRNGAGKSTLLRVAGGIYPQTSGTVYVTSTPAAIFEMGLFGNIFLTGRNFCDVYFSFRNVPARKKKDLIKDVEEFAELGHYFDVLSGPTRLEWPPDSCSVWSLPFLRMSFS